MSNKSQNQKQKQKQKQLHQQRQEIQDNDDYEEATHWKDVMRTLLHYEDFVAVDIRRRQEHLNRLPNKWADRLPQATFTKLEGLSHAARGNQDFFIEMVTFQSGNSARTQNVLKPGRLPNKNDGAQISYAQQHRNQAILHSLYREWSVEAAKEREASMTPMIEELLRLLPVTKENAYQQRVLVPGCGLGRLPLEIAARGYSTQGNEFSAFMAIASNFVLNALTEPKVFTIRPWLDKICNVVNVEDVMQTIQVPDVAACEMLASCPFYDLPQKQPHEECFFPRFSMCSGDFVEIYGPRIPDNVPVPGGKSCLDCSDVTLEGLKSDTDEQWDSVVTCFFVDTAPVVLDYVDVIFKMLKPGGVWINLGPLLYHWVTDVEDNNDPRYQQSIELSWEELRHVIAGYGFKFEKEEFRECCYTSNTKSMMWSTYKAIFFSVTKPL